MTPPRIDVHVNAADLTAGLARDVAKGLTGNPKTLPPKYFYDARGSALFEQITRLPEYYPTRAERALLAAHAGQAAKLASAGTLVELGSGSSEKTRLLLDAMSATGGIHHYVPVDVSRSALGAAAASLHREYPGLRIHGLVVDIEHQLHLLPAHGARLVAFLGGTIGNQTPAERHRFLGELRAGLGPDDSLLLGVDLVKDPARLVAAYDDAAGVTAEFNRNVLHVINRELDADFAPEAFAHVAVWEEEREWIEMHLRSRKAQTIRLGALDMDVSFRVGEHVRTEISAKFRRDGLEAELTSAGFEPQAWWTEGDFALSLSGAGS